MATKFGSSRDSCQRKIFLHIAAAAIESGPIQSRNLCQDNPKINLLFRMQKRFGNFTKCRVS